MGATGVRRTTRPASVETPANRSRGVVDWFKQWRVVSNEVKLLTERKNDLRDRLMGYLEEHGTADDKGNTWLEFVEPVDGVSQLKRERRASSTLNLDRAEKLLTRKGLLVDAQVTTVVVPAQYAEAVDKFLSETLGISDDVYQLQTDIDPDAIYTLYHEKKGVTDRDLQKLIDVNETFAFKPIEAK